ncbi:MAG: ATP-dependent RecD-like DNA helicase [Kiritimatiellaeota bacterium]|nr:ATP-dependent RecD-like DNA helicase [Kiritimatiellota bacterium]
MPPKPPQKPPHGESAAKAASAAKNASEEISGAVESVVYSNDETGYRVFKVRVSGGGYYGAKDESVTVSGKCTTLWEGEEIRAGGRWVNHPQYGLQFEAQTITCVVPTSTVGIEKYLKSGMIKGIGSVYAKKIVERFGAKTLEIIDANSARLLEIPGIGAERKRLIKDSWDAQRGNRETMIFLQSNGITTAYAARVIRAYGAGTIAVVKQNPYRLCQDIWGIGFTKADEIAQKVGVPRDSPERAKAGIHFTLEKLADDGHCFCTEPDLLLHAEQLVGIPVEILANALKEECEAGRLVKDADRIYLRRLWNAEIKTARKLRSLLDTPARFPAIQAEPAIGWAEGKSAIQLAPKQRAALAMALTSKVSVITGGPGVGKTTIIRALCEIWYAKNLRVNLVAPTGRAAKRMSESTGRDAKTIHRLLKFNPQTRRFAFDEQNQLDTEILIADETSMIDIELAADLLSALQDKAVVVFVGDTDQLPSVGPGNFLRDLINSRVIPCTRLDVIFRQKSGGGIVRNAHLVNAGEMFEKNETGGATPSPASLYTSDFFFVNCDSPEKILANVVEMVKHRIPRKFGMSPLEDVQILTPMRKNLLGADNLNLVLQEALNPRGVSVQRLGRHYRVGDRVMQIRNNYDKEVFNGDLGFIKTIDLTDSTLTVDFDGVPVEYDFNELDELTHSYAVTIHKSQGSEYPAVIVVIATQHFVLLQRNLLYTAITRGKKLVIVIGSYKAVSLAVKNNETQARATALAEKLKTVES